MSSKTKKTSKKLFPTADDIVKPDYLIPGHRYYMYVTKKYTENAAGDRITKAEAGMVTKMAGTFMGHARDPISRANYAAFKNVEILAKDSLKIHSYDGGKIQNYFFGMNDYPEKAIRDKDGNITDIKHYGHQELNILNPDFSKKEFLLRLSNWTFIRGSLNAARGYMMEQVMTEKFGFPLEQSKKMNIRGYLPKTNRNENFGYVPEGYEPENSKGGARKKRKTRRSKKRSGKTRKH